MIVAILLRNELLKMLKRLAFVVTYVFFMGVTTIGFADKFVRARNDPDRTFALPDDWPEILSSDPEAAMFFGAIVLMLLVASEFSWRTARQNVIDGLSKEQWFLGKLLVLPILTVLFIGGHVLLGATFASLGGGGGPGPVIRGADWSALLGLTLAFMGTGAVAFFIALAARASGPAIGAFFLYIVVVEQLLGGALVRLSERLQPVVQFFPFNTFSQLTNYRLHSDEAFQAFVQRAIEGGRAIPEQGDLGFVLLMGFVWIAAFLGAAFVWFQKRDL